MTKRHEEVAYKAVESGELEIDHQGRIWRVMKRTYDRWTKGVKVTPCKRVRAEMLNPQGYLQVRVMRNSRRVYAAAHRMVWFHFNGAIPDGLTINHKNGRKDDNRPLNLEIATQSEQRTHAVEVLNVDRNRPKGEKNPKAQATERDVIEMRRRRAAGEQVKTIAESFGMTPKAVSAICCRRTWKHLP